MENEKAKGNVQKRSGTGSKKTGHSKSNIRKSTLETSRKRSAGNSRTGMRNVKLNETGGAKTVSRTTGTGKSRSGSRNRKKKTRIPSIYLAGGAAVVLLLLVIIFAVKSCGISHKTPEGVVRGLIESYSSENEKKIRNCSGVKTADENLQQEIDATVKYFEAHNTEKIEITDCNSIYSSGQYTYMYITYNLVQKDGQSYPCISTYMTQKKDNNKYYILMPSDITEDMNKQAAEKYALFMKTDAYKTYSTAYEKFIKKNPGYEDKIAAKLK